jgi:multiple sugar transport system ATP-binding protein
VYLVENLGMHNLVSCHVDSSETEPFSLRALLPPDQHWSDNEMTLALPPQNIHWFDVNSGDALRSAEAQLQTIDVKPA